MTTPSIATFTEATVTGGPSLSVTEPSSLASGDLIVIMVSCDLGNNNYWPDGSTLADTYNDMAAQHGGNSADVQSHVYWRICDDTETWPLTISDGVNSDKVGWCLRIIDHDETTPIDVVSAWAGEDSNGSTLVMGSITPTSGSLIIAYTGTDGGDMTPATIDSGTGYTVDDTLESGSPAQGVGSSYATKTATGSASPLTFGYNVSDGRMGIQFAIAEGAAAAAEQPAIFFGCNF